MDNTKPPSTPTTTPTGSATPNTGPSPAEMREAYRLNALKRQKPEAIAREKAIQNDLKKLDLSKRRVW